MKRNIYLSLVILGLYFCATLWFNSVIYSENFYFSMFKDVDKETLKKT